MSLKAKIEAVIYASEEPVTLAQLAGLLGQEAQAELDALASRQLELVATGADDETAASDESGTPNEAEEPAQSQPDPEALPEPPATAKAEPDDSPAAESEQPAPAAQASDSAEARQLAADKRDARDAERRLRDYLAEIVAELIRDYAIADRGLEIREVAGGLRLGTKPEYHDAVRGFVRSLKPPLKLTLQSLETLAVVAYKQPVTAPEVSEIRGVDSGGVLGSLITRKLVTTAGRKQVVGRPMLYRTSKDFLVRFGLKDLTELPSIEEFEKMAGELAEQEEITMPESTETTAEERVTHENLEAERGSVETQADGDSSSLAADESQRSHDQTPAVDGRLSGVPPAYDQAGDNPSADEASIQSAGEGA